MPRIQSQMVETPGTQVSASDDFDAEAQARLEELLKQARASVENKAKKDCQQFKADLDKNKQGVTNRRCHLLRTHQEEYHQLGKGLKEELEGFAGEEAGVLARLKDILEGYEGDKDLGKLANELQDAAAELTQVDTGCLDVWQTLPDDERSISAKLLGERIDPSELDSGRNVGELPEGALSDEDPSAKEAGGEDLEKADVEMQHSATKKRSGGRHRR